MRDKFTEEQEAIDFLFYNKHVALVSRLTKARDLTASGRPLPWHLLSTANVVYDSLKKVMRSENIRNMSWHKRARKWVVYVRREGEAVYVGVFRDLQDAIHAQREAQDKK